MLILSIDTAMNGCSAGIYNTETGECVSETVDMNRGHAEHLVPMIERILGKASVTYDDVNAIAVTRGPGAFTGMRIGLSTAKALSLSLAIPCIGVTTLEAIARFHVKTDHPVEAFSVLIETKRSDFYYQEFDLTGNALNAPVSKTAEQIAAIKEGGASFVGDAVMRFQGEVGALFEEGDLNLKAYNLVDVCTVAQIAYERLEGAGVVEGVSVSPLYIRGADVSTPKVKYRVLQK